MAIALLLSVAGPVPAAASAAPEVLTETPVTPMDRGVNRAHNSPTLAVDPSEPRFVALANRVDAPDFGCTLHLSGDAGRTWAPAAPVPELPAGADKCYAPEVAFDGDGVLHYLFVGLTGAGNEPMGAFLTTSDDRGRSFSPPRQVLGPLKFSVRMAIDRSAGGAGRLHLAWLDARSDPPTGGFGPPPNPIMAAHSDDSGKTFSDPVQVSDPDRQRVVAPALALGPDGAVHVAYYDLGDDVVDYQGLEGGVWDGTWSLLVASSSDRGDTFAPGAVVDDGIVPAERVMLVFTMPPPALAAGEQHLCAAWPDGRHGDADAMARCSTDGGGQWGPERRLNDDPQGNGRSQYLPALSLAPGGRLDAVYYDRRNHSRNVGTDVSYTYSTDGGDTFAPSVVVTGAPSSSQIGQRYPVPSAAGMVEFGSRLALASSQDRALTAWTDTRNSLPQTTAQDIFAASVHPPASPAGAGRTLLVAGAALVVVLAVAALAARRRRAHGPADPEAQAT